MSPDDGRIRDAGTVVDVLCERDRRGEEAGFVFLADGEHESEVASWSALAERVRAVSAAVRRHAGVGDRALLLFGPGLDFLVAFLGCLHAGVVAVPCVPPRRPLRRTFDRIREVLRIASPSVLLSSGTPVDISEEMRTLAPDLRDCPLVDPKHLGDVPPERRSAATPGGIAFLQFTSGSTSAPRGVMVTHANLMHNLGYIHDRFEHGPASVAATWLPVYHDMGLIDGLLGPIFGGFRCFAMPPHAFVQRPVRWLRLVDRYRVTHTGGPNFAYDLCVANVSPDEARNLDLSSWRLAYNGAEPVRTSTLEAFSRHFECAGFRPDAFNPCYGLAEATLMVTSGRGPEVHPCCVDGAALEAGRIVEVPHDAPRGQMIASSGTASCGMGVLIVDPESRREAADGEIGEIWVSGPSVTRGYFDDPAATTEVFSAWTEGVRSGPYLRTGDLGFILRGELYVAGRLKDLIILSGRNLFPQDIERSAELAHPSLRIGFTVAFSIDEEDREELIVLVEVDALRGTARDGDEQSEGSFAGVLKAVDQAIARDHQVNPSVVGAVPRGELLKTSSGKIRRGACRAAYRAGQLTVLERQGPPAQ